MTLLRNQYFVQTAAINPEAQGVAFKDEIMGRFICFAHSTRRKYTLGLLYNINMLLIQSILYVRPALLKIRNRLRLWIMHV